MRSYGHTEEYLKGYKRGIKGALFSESVVENLNVYRMLFASNDELKDREQGYEDGLRDHDILKWEYETGLNRGFKGKDSPLGVDEIVSFERIFFQTGDAQRAREDGYHDGLKALDRQRWW